MLMYATLFLQYFFFLRKSSVEAPMGILCSLGQNLSVIFFLPIMPTLEAKMPLW